MLEVSECSAPVQLLVILTHLHTPQLLSATLSYALSPAYYASDLFWSEFSRVATNQRSWAERRRVPQIPPSRLNTLTDSRCPTSQLHWATDPPPANSCKQSIAPSPSPALAHAHQASLPTAQDAACGTVSRRCDGCVWETACAAFDECMYAYAGGGGGARLACVRVRLVVLAATFP